MVTTTCKIAPSLLSADFSRLGDEIRAIEEAGADLIHLDVMDGHFVPNITIGPFIVEAIRQTTTLPLDTHLMIQNPSKYIGDFVKAGADLISIHTEVFSHERDLHAALDQIRHFGKHPCLAVNPETPIETVFPFLANLDMVLVMTVHPGFGGQSFIPTCLEKIKTLRLEIDQRGLSTEIEVDGGIKIHNVHEVTGAGATVIVAGSAIFKSPDYAQTIREMRAKKQASPTNS